MPGSTAPAVHRRRVGMAALAAAALALPLLTGGGNAPAVGFTPGGLLPFAAKERATPSPGDAARESKESKIAAEQFAQARTAPGIVSPGAYGAAFRQLDALRSSAVGGSWSELTNRPYQSDDPYFRDYYSNSGSGAGLVTGRITGLVADDEGHVYAAGANGGVWRAKQAGGGNWTPIADQLPSLSSGDLALDGAALWYATGEANTGGTSYVGSGVYALTSPTSQLFTPDSRVGGHELESTTINRIRFAGGRAYVATNRGIWSHSTDLANRRSEPWRFEYTPELSWMPEITDDAGNVLVPEGSNLKAAGDSGATNAAYKNIVNDLVLDPKNAQHMVASIAWRSGDTYNGFYESRNITKGRSSWRKIEPKGDINGKDIGNTSFAFSGDASKLYAIVQSPALLQAGADTSLGGIYVSPSGSIDGPWKKIADSAKLAASGSGIAPLPGYQPGIQAWYNQFLIVDPSNPKHVYAGLEEVYESTNGGQTWQTVGPYWNFFFACWGTDYKTPTAGCNNTSHADQHSAAIGMTNGKPFFYAGNDGGVFRRPLNGSTDAEGHATDWVSLNDGTIDALQYYGLGVGAAKASVIKKLDDYKSQRYPTRGEIVSGGLQDNGGSILFTGDPGRKMSSNFGGDGGDVLVDPGNGCNIVQEYVFLSMRVTNECAQASSPDAFFYTDKANTRSIDPGDPNPRFIAPFGADQTRPSHWVAGGEYVWAQGKGFGIQSGNDWTPVADTGARHSITALASSDDVVYAGWCGTCNNLGFTRGLTRVEIHYDAKGVPTGTQREVVLPDSAALPNRFISGIAINPSDHQNVFVAVNGFSRRFTEGPGAGFGHVYETKDGGATWTDVSANLPDVPASSIKVTKAGALVLGTDLGAFYRAAGAAKWNVLGRGLPLTVVMDVELYGGSAYVATHGRGIWKIPLPA